MREIEIWEPYTADIKLFGTANDIHVYQAADRLIIQIELQPSHDFYEIMFMDWVTYFISHQDRSCQITEHNQKGGIYLVKNSLLKEMESFDWKGQHDDCYHFVIPTPDLNVEILSREKPKFRIIGT